MIVAPGAIDECGDFPQRVFRHGLLALADPADRRVFGLRRELYRQIAVLVGAVRVGSHMRLMQFSEIDIALRDLNDAGAVRNLSDGEVVEVVLCA